MAVQYRNYLFTYEQDGKPIFAPSKLGERIGLDIKAQVEAAYQFDSFVYHLKKSGGHVAALHAHRDHQYFARIDIKRFFYSIARNRVQRCLSEIGILRSRHYAKWSCVKNPYLAPAYCLPYGFVQSPVLATLVLMSSTVGCCLRQLEAERTVTISVYMDDISLSSDNERALQSAFENVLLALKSANFEVNDTKVRAPSAKMDIFNCDLAPGKVEVQQQRIDTFYAEQRSPLSIAGFEEYLERVRDGNGP